MRSCCRLAALLDLPLTAAAQNVVPVAVTAAESVERLRQWASGRCLDAEGGGIYPTLFFPPNTHKQRDASVLPMVPAGAALDEIITRLA